MKVYEDIIFIRILLLKRVASNPSREETRARRFLGARSVGRLGGEALVRRAGS
jgi:hypothetical protein